MARASLALHPRRSAPARSHAIAAQLRRRITALRTRRPPRPRGWLKPAATSWASAGRETGCPDVAGRHSVGYGAARRPALLQRTPAPEAVRREEHSPAGGQRRARRAAVLGDASPAEPSCPREKTFKALFLRGRP